MKLMLMLLSLIFISSTAFLSNANAGPVECVKAAVNDEYLRLLDMTWDQTLRLCAGASSNAPVDCFKKALGDDFLRLKEMTKEQAIALCSQK